MARSSSASVESGAAALMTAPVIKGPFPGSVLVIWRIWGVIWTTIHVICREIPVIVPEAAVIWVSRSPTSGSVAPVRGDAPDGAHEIMMRDGTAVSASASGVPLHRRTTPGGG